MPGFLRYIIPMYRDRNRKPTRLSHFILILRLVPVLILLPAAVALGSDFNGQTLPVAFERSWETLHAPWLWGSVLAVAGLIILYLNSVMDFFRCWCLDASRCRLRDADKAIKRINGLYGFIIIVSILGFLGGEALSQRGLGPLLIKDGLRQLRFVNALANGLLSGVLVAFNVDNLLFPVKRAALSQNPATRLRRHTLYKKINLIILSLLTYLFIQVFSASDRFFEIATRFKDFMHAFPEDGDVTAELAKMPDLEGSLEVIGVKLIFYFYFVGLMLFQIKRMIGNPIDTMKDRLTLLNSDRAERASEIDVLSNDEFTDVLREVNVLIARQRNELASSSSRLEMVVQQAADPIICFDRAGTILVCNPAAQAFFGYGRDEALHTPLAALLELPSELEAQCRDQGRTEAVIDYLYARDEGLKRFTGVRKDGGKVMFESNVSSAESNGSVIYTAILRDVSKQLELEARLTDAKLSAENANRLKTEFLSNMSHELRTPLNAVLGFTQLMSDDKNLTPGQLEKIAIISRSGEHLLSLINDILDISKIEAGKQELHETVFDPSRFVEDIKEMFSLRCQKAGLGLYVELTGDIPPRVRGDLGKLRQVMINLVGNAVKFTGDGGISLVVGPEVDEAGNPVPNRVRFAVSDSGKGIPADELELIMQPFRQSSLNDHEGGTGLGLAISSRYIQLMGGTLEVKSEVGKGSTFSFAIDLPATDEAVPDVGGDDVAVAVKKGAAVTALIVDDKELNRLVLKEMLEGAGFVTVEAENGKVAVERAHDTRVGVVFMDIKMPVMDGYEAVRELKADDSTRAIPVFALTASAFTNDEARILASGFDGFLAKPFKRSSLFRLIKEKSGIELEYATAQSQASHSAPDLDSVDYARSAAALGPSGVDELDGYLLINDFTAIKSLSARLGPDLGGLAAALAYHADGFDEAALSAIVARLRDAKPKEGGK